MTNLGYFFLSTLKVTRSCLWLFGHESLLPSGHSQAVRGTFFHLGSWGAEKGRDFLLIHIWSCWTFLWESSYYLKDGSCLSLPLPNEAVNHNKRIWLNKFPIQTLSCGQRTLWIWLLCLASCDGVESYVFTVAEFFSPFSVRRPFPEKGVLNRKGTGEATWQESSGQAISG